jgi:hypothetical protein
MFKYWDSRGPKNFKTVMKLFGLPPATSTMIQQWLLEWMGEEEFQKMLNKYEGRELRGEAGTYDFRFYIDNLRIYTHGGVEIYFDATVDGDGTVDIEGPGFTIDTVYKAHMNEDFGWEVDDEIRDTIIDTLHDLIDTEFEIYIDHLSVTEPGMFDK